MENEKIKWVIKYCHDDGRTGTITVETEINGKMGIIEVDGDKKLYDLRYNKGNLHWMMISDYFGKGLVSYTTE